MKSRIYKPVQPVVKPIAEGEPLPYAPHWFPPMELEDRLACAWPRQLDDPEADQVDSYIGGASFINGYPAGEVIEWART